MKISTAGQAVQVAAPAILFVLMLVGMGLASSSDMEEARRAENKYCADVADGLYRDWRELCGPIPLE